MFLSNCIAKKNYTAFLITIILATLLSLLVGIMSLVAFIIYFTDNSSYMITCIVVLISL